jgi:hypothetical protein
MTNTQGFNIRDFTPNYWGKLKQFQVPTHLFKNNVLCVSPSAAAILLFLYFKARGRHKQLLHSWREEISVVASQKEFTQKTGYSRNTVTSAMKELVARGWLEPPAQRRPKYPLTGEPPIIVPVAESDPSSYYDRDGRPLILNQGNPEALLKWVEDSLPPGEDLHPEGDDEHKLRCPFHPDRNPSLNFNPKKNAFYCFGCGAKGTTRKLVMQLTGISESEAIKCTPERLELILYSSLIPAQKPFTITGTRTESCCTRFCVTRGSGSRNGGRHPAAIFTTSKG